MGSRSQFHPQGTDISVDDDEDNEEDEYDDGSSGEEEDFETLDVIERAEIYCHDEQDNYELELRGKPEELPAHEERGRMEALLIAQGRRLVQNVLKNSGHWEQWWPLTHSLKQDMPDKATQGQWEQCRRLVVKALGVIKMPSVRKPISVSGSTLNCMANPTPFLSTDVPSQRTLMASLKHRPSCLQRVAPQEGPHYLGLTSAPCFLSQLSASVGAHAPEHTTGIDSPQAG
ncbi:hypothetical protein DFH08DRAFT_806025 [Mycena albidolilacea]|uniref:Uncharacterized protein n=1 Tax=Mycena albidolilacea TaxID=1033008 RepID=A0AAD7A899_9AGAR|nr:hypothetical protein DFH08DRAFT_806025 [Mycena albidolilacea]